MCQHISHTHHTYLTRLMWVLGLQLPRRVKCEMEAAGKKCQNDLFVLVIHSAGIKRKRPEHLPRSPTQSPGQQERSSVDRRAPGVVEEVKEKDEPKPLSSAGLQVSTLHINHRHTPSSQSARLTRAAVLHTKCEELRTDSMASRSRRYIHRSWLCGAVQSKA